MAANTNFFATSDETESRFYSFLDLIAKGGVYKSADKDFHPFKGTSYQEKTKQAHFFMDALSPQSLYEFSYGRAKLLTLPGLSYSPYNLNPLAFAHTVRKMLPTDIRRSLYLYHLIATKDICHDESSSEVYQNGLQHPLHYYAKDDRFTVKDDSVLEEGNLKRYLNAINEEILITQDETTESKINTTQLFDSASSTLYALGLLASHPTLKNGYILTPNPIVSSNLTEDEQKELRYALDFQKYISPISSYAHYLQFKLGLITLEEGTAPEDILSDMPLERSPEQPSPILVRQIPPFKTLLDDKRLAVLASMNTWCTITSINRGNPKHTSKLATTKTLNYIDQLEESLYDSREYIYGTSKHNRPLSPMSLDSVQSITTSPVTPLSRKQSKTRTPHIVYIAFHTCPAKDWNQLQRTLHQFCTQRISMECIPQDGANRYPFLIKVIYMETTSLLPLLYQLGPYLHFVTSSGEEITEDMPNIDYIQKLKDLALTRVRSILSHYES